MECNTIIRKSKNIKKEKEKEKEQECIICFNNNYRIIFRTIKVVNINTLTHIFKECKCSYFIHRTCIEVWIKLKPMCLICCEGIYIL